MRRLFAPLLVFTLASGLSLPAARASGGVVIMIPLLLAAELIGALAAPFRCHPQTEKIELEVAGMEVDGIALKPADPPGSFYVAAYEPGKIIAALADPSAEPPGAARDHGLIIPELL